MTKFVQNIKRHWKWALVMGLFFAAVMYGFYYLLLGSDLLAQESGTRQLVIFILLVLTPFVISFGLFGVFNLETEPADLRRMDWIRGKFTDVEDFLLYLESESARKFWLEESVLFLALFGALVYIGYSGEFLSLILQMSGPIILVVAYRYYKGPRRRMLRLAGESRGTVFAMTPDQEKKMIEMRQQLERRARMWRYTANAFLIVGIIWTVSSFFVGPLSGKELIETVIWAIRNR